MNNVKRWYSHLMSQDVFHKSSSEVTGGKGVSAFKVTKRQKLDICIRVNFNYNIISMGQNSQSNMEMFQNLPSPP